MVFNVLDYGAEVGGEVLCTKAVQKAVDECSAAGGGIVRFEGGRYALSTVFLRSNVTVEICENAEIVGAESFYDYEQQEPLDYPLYQDASHSYFHLAMFVGIDCENICITGKGKIDMRSVWDEDDVRKIVHRGPKCISLKNCKNVEVSGLEIYRVTDLAVYFAGCENVDIFGLKMSVYIDGISPDNSKNVRIHDCDVESGDDGIVFKSSYTLNKIDICKDIHVWDCKVKSRCSALKFGTETNGGFENILIENVEVYDTRISGLAIESVDGAIIDGITVKNVQMKNVNAPIFIHVGRRMRGPKGRAIGSIKNVLLENITVTGPYEPYDVIVSNYNTFVTYGERKTEYPSEFRYGKIDTSLEEIKAKMDDEWQITSNICGLKESPLQNITLKNVYLKVYGGVQEYSREVPENPPAYPEANIYGWTLPAKGIYFRHVEGLTLDNVTIESYRPDTREDFVFENVQQRDM